MSPSTDHTRPLPFPKAVLFDLDGTLVDSVPDLTVAVNQALSQIGYRDVTRAEVTGMVGDGIPKLVERAVHLVGAGSAASTAAELGNLTRICLDYYQDHSIDLTAPYPGAREAVAALHDNGVALGICTNKPEAPTRDILDALELAPFFAAVFGGDSVPGIRKPDPGHVTAVLSALDTQPEDAVMVGDSANDIKAGAGAGLKTVAVSFGYAHSPVAELGADTVIDHFDDLADALAGLTGAS